MKNLNTFKTFALTLLLGVAGGCSGYLDTIPVDKSSPNTFLKGIEQAKSMLAGIYYCFYDDSPAYITPVLDFLCYLLAFPLIFYGVWLLVMRFYRRRYLRRLRLQEIVSLRRANKSLRQELSERDAEIVAQSTTLVSRNDMVLRMRDMVNDFQSKYGNRTTAVLCQKINSYVSGHLDTESDWTLFLIKFEQKHSDYFRIMKERYPDLTTNDLRLSACLKMNLCTKEIASMMNLSVRAVENSRYRLRKKLGLTSAQNLNEFLMHIDSQESEPKDDEVQDPDL